MPSNENSQNSIFKNFSSTKYVTIYHSAKSITWLQRSSRVRIVIRRARHPRGPNPSSVDDERRPNSCKVKETFPVQNDCPSIIVFSTVSLLPQLFQDSFWSVVDRSAINVAQQRQFFVNRGNDTGVHQLGAIRLLNLPISHRTFEHKGRLSLKKPLASTITNKFK